MEDELIDTDRVHLARIRVMFASRFAQKISKSLIDPSIKRWYASPRISHPSSTRLPSSFNFVLVIFRYSTYAARCGVLCRDDLNNGVWENPASNERSKYHRSTLKKSVFNVTLQNSFVDLKKLSNVLKGRKKLIFKSTKPKKVLHFDTLSESSPQNLLKLFTKPKKVLQEKN